MLSAPVGAVTLSLKEERSFTHSILARFDGIPADDVTPSGDMKALRAYYMKASTVYIGLGSNLGDRTANLREAGHRLSAIITIEKASQLYVAAPLGYVRDDAFVNAVIRGTTTLKPMELLEIMQAIEAAMGRRPGVQYGPRPIDLDLLFYDAVQIETSKLTIPHPRIAQRAFVLKPLAEIAPNLMHPVLYYTISQLLHDTEDVEQVQIYQPEQNYARAF
jgi:2-amino-4-hydroxy-6-hydroxymethyldihydropteridine diphosphokinase